MYSNRRFFPLKGVSTSANTGKVSCRLLITIQNIISSYRCKKCAYNLVVSNICVTHTHTHTHTFSPPLSARVILKNKHVSKWINLQFANFSYLYPSILSSNPINRY